MLTEHLHFLTDLSFPDIWKFKVIALIHMAVKAFGSLAIQ